MNKPCEYCGAGLPFGVNKRTRRVRSAHFSSCPKRPPRAEAPEPADDLRTAILRCRYPVDTSIRPSGFDWDINRLEEVLGLERR